MFVMVRGRLMKPTGSEFNAPDGGVNVSDAYPNTAPTAMSAVILADCNSPFERANTEPHVEIEWGARG